MKAGRVRGGLEKRWAGAGFAPVFERYRTYSRAFAMGSGIACLTSGGMCCMIQVRFIMSSVHEQCKDDQADDGYDEPHGRVAPVVMHHSHRRS